MKVHFRPPTRRGPERLVSEAEVHFEEGPLAGMRLLGFCVWRNDEGVAYVTFPSRVITKGGARLYVDYLTSVNGSMDVVRRFKAWILDEYRKWVDAGATRPGGGRARP